MWQMFVFEERVIYISNANKIFFKLKYTLSINSVIVLLLNIIMIVVIIYPFVASLKMFQCLDNNMSRKMITYTEKQC